MFQITRAAAEETLNAISAFSTTLPAAQSTVLNSMISQLGRSLVAVQPAPPAHAAPPAHPAAPRKAARRADKNVSA